MKLFFFFPFYIFFVHFNNLYNFDSQLVSRLPFRGYLSKLKMKWQRIERTAVFFFFFGVGVGKGMGEEGGVFGR